MLLKITPASKEAPADRLGILYVTSFLIIAILSGVTQFFILRELASQASLASSVVQLVGQGLLGRPLSLTALAALAEKNKDKQLSLLESFRGVLDQRASNSRPIASIFLNKLRAEGSSSPASQSISNADAHQASAAYAANNLWTLLQKSGPEPIPATETDPLLRTILDEENAAAVSVAEAVRSAELDSVADFARLEKLEFELFGLVVIALVLEGLFVVNPAIRKIRSFMRDMERSNQQLESYSRKLEHSNRELQDFASIASHDLQEPLRKIQAFSDRLRSRCGSTLEPQGRDYLDRVQNAASRMQTLINDLLTYARVSTKVQPFTQTDLVTITNEVLSDLEARIEQVQGKIEVGELPQLDADPMQVRQLMQNLIGNALKYKRPDVPPIVKISGTPPHRNASIRPADAAEKYCQIFIEDNGIGFDDIYSEKIFTIFQRLHGRSEYEGTGVGLAVCRKIVERHGGTITAKGTPGHGSTFTITLPLRQPKEKPADASAA